MPNNYENPTDLWRNGIEHPKARPLVTKIMEADTDTDWKIGGDGDNGEQLVSVLSSVFRAEDREKQEMRSEVRECVVKWLRNKAAEMIDSCERLQNGDFGGVELPNLPGNVSYRAFHDDLLRIAKECE